MKAQLSTKDLILLSSLLDDELNPREKARVETRLQAEPELRDAFESLRRTKEVLRRAPARRVPHNFTIPASMARAKPARSFRAVPGLLWSSAVTAIVSILFVAATLFGTQFLGARPASAPRDTTMQAQLAAPETAPAAEPTQSPPMVYWDGLPTPQVAIGGGAEVTGKGGAGGYGGGPGSYVPNVYATAPPVVSEPAPESTPMTEAGLGAMAPTATPETQPTAPAQAEQPVTGTGPILGVAPDAQQGEVLPETNLQYLPEIAAVQADAPARSGAALPTLVWVGIGLFVVAAGLFVTAFLLRRKAPR